MRQKIRGQMVMAEAGIIARDNILTHEKRVKLQSMSTYWWEVKEREDKSLLGPELHQVYSMVGTDLLFIIARYIELTEEK